MIEIAQKVFSKAGHTVKYTNLDFDTAMAEIGKGTFTAFPGCFKADAPGFVFPEESIGVAENVFFVKKDSKWRYTGADSLKNVKVGVVSGYTYGDTLDPVFAEKKKAGEMFESDDLNPLEILVDNLVAGKIDTLIENPAVVTDFMVDNAMFDILSNIKEVGTEGAPEPLYFAFSPANPKSKEYADILSKGIAELRKSGELVSILNKYEMKDWK
jgi:polar amino acid transport system substrate-binding protein